MEVYKITNIRTGKVYVGSTVSTKERRFITHLSHIRNNCIDLKFYEEIIRDNDIDNLYLESLEVVDGNNVSLLRDRESYWIRYHLYKLGRSKLYNRHLKHGGHCDHFRTPESTRKSLETHIKVYGSAWGAANTKEAREKSRRAQSTKVLMEDGTMLYGNYDFYKWTVENGYQLSRGVCTNLVTSNFLSKKNRSLYPELDPDNPGKIWKVID